MYEGEDVIQGRLKWTRILKSDKKQATWDLGLRMI